MMMPSLIEAPLGRVHSSILWALIPLSIRYEMYDVSVHNSKSTAKLVFIYKSVCWPGVRDLCILSVLYSAWHIVGNLITMRGKGEKKEKEREKRGGVRREGGREGRKE